MTNCIICNEEIDDDKGNLCSSCNKKRKITEIIYFLVDKINFDEYINESVFNKLGISDNVLQGHNIWVLDDVKLINEISKGNYEWTDMNDIIEFMKKYSIDNGDKFSSQIKHISSSQNIDNLKKSKETISQSNDNNISIEFTEIKDQNTIDSRIKEYLSKYIEVFDHEITNNDIIHDNVFKNFNIYLNNEFHEKINKRVFKKNFVGLLHENTNAEHLFINSRTYYNIGLLYNNSEKNNDTNHLLDKHEHSTTDKEDITINYNMEYTPNYLVKERFEEYIKENIIITNMATKNCLTYTMIYDDFLKFLYYKYSEKYYQYDFENLFKEFQINSNLTKTFFYGKIYFNLTFINGKINYDPIPSEVLIKQDVDIFIDKIKDNHSEEIDEQPKININTQHKNNVSLPKSSIKDSNNVKDEDNNLISPKVFSGSYNNKTIMFLKSVISIKHYNTILDLLFNTKEYIHKVSVNKVDTEYLDISIEFLVNNEKKDILLKNINKYIWD